MKKLTVLTAWLLIAATLLLCGCTPEDKGGEIIPAESTAYIESTTAPDAVESYILASKGGADPDFFITRSEYSDQALTGATADLYHAIEAKFSKAPMLQTDWNKDIPRNEYGEVPGKEILIGDTNRVESRDALSGLAEETFVIKWVGEKLVIVGSDDYASAAAVAYFIENYVDTAEGDALVIPADLDYVGEAPLQKISLAEGAELRIMSFNIAGESREYDSRREHIFTTILDYLPDVVGFQEANRANHTQILRSVAIAKYYKMNVYAHNNSSPVNYTPILYLKSKYQQIEGGVEFLNSRHKATSTKSLSWTVLERISDGQRFIVVNMHGSLWMDTYMPPAGETQASMKAKASKEWKDDNAQQMIDKITELQAKYGNIPAFTTGDYNFNSKHSAYGVMKSTGLKNAQEEAPSAVRGASYHSTVGAQPDAGGLAIDHIFYTPDTAVPIKHVIGKRQSDLDASDHCPVYTDFAFQ